MNNVPLCNKIITVYIDVRLVAETGQEIYRNVYGIRCSSERGLVSWFNNE